MRGIAGAVGDPGANVGAVLSLVVGCDAEGLKSGCCPVGEVESDALLSALLPSAALPLLSLLALSCGIATGFDTPSPPK